MKTIRIVGLAISLALFLQACHKHEEPEDPSAPFYGVWDAAKIWNYNADNTLTEEDTVEGLSLYLYENHEFQVMADTIKWLAGTWYYDVEANEIEFEYRVMREISIWFITYDWQSVSTERAEVISVTDNTLKLKNDYPDEEWDGYFILEFRRRR